MDYPELLVFPPVLPIGGLILSLVLEWLCPLAQKMGWLPGPVRGIFAGVLLSMGAAIFIGSHVALGRARTGVNPRQPTLWLAENWPYNWSRNPMYLGGDLAFLGIGLAFRQYWMLLLFPIMQTVCHIGVVLREEQYLEKKFGARYLDYKARVRRWL